MQNILVKNGHVVDPLQNVDDTCDIRIAEGRVMEIGKNLAENGEHVIDAAGLMVFPGLVDMHVHLRDPGLTYKEDILTGSEAAAAGGVTALAAMPNTSPVIDTEELVQYIVDKGKQAKAKVYPIASATMGQDGGMLTDFALLKKAGAVAVSDDGKPVENAAVMQRVLEQGKEDAMLVISHCEDLDIIDGGIINKGRVSQELGVKGMDRTSEDSITARELALAMGTNSRIHIAHVSTKGSVGLIRAAKEMGVQVTCETCPHYFTLTEQELLKKDADYRMNPPLREEEDRLAVLEGILDGTIDCIVTDHAPHAADEKADFESAPNGVVGLETSLAVSYGMLVKDGKLSWPRLIELMSATPAKILGIEAGSLCKGATADIAIFDPQKEWTVEPEKLHSKSKNSVFKGKTLQGKVVYTILNGEIVFEDQ